MPNVANIDQLNAAITAADRLSANSGVYTITFTKNIALGPIALKAINLQKGVTLDIEGGGDALGGGGSQRGLFVYSGVVNVSDLTIQNMLALGGAGGNDGGGGAGLGGGLFIADNVSGGAAVAGKVTLDDVSFSNDSATGGAGAGSHGGGGGGGGLGGSGGAGLGSNGGNFDDGR